MLFYTACTECKKKVNPNENTAGWFCEKCQKVYPECNYTYNFSVQIGDYTSAVYAQVLGDNVGNVIFGMEAKELKGIMDASQNESNPGGGENS
jgi:replication factor A1